MRADWRALQGLVAAALLGALMLVGRAAMPERWKIDFSERDGAAAGNNFAPDLGPELGVMDRAGCGEGDPDSRRRRRGRDVARTVLALEREVEELTRRVDELRRLADKQERELRDIRWRLDPRNVQ